MPQKDKQFETIAKRFSDIDVRFDEMDSKITNFRNEVLTGLDKILVIVQRVDQERVFANATIKRHQEKIENIEKVLNIKQ